MVRGRKKGVGGTFRFSPITSQNQTGRSGRTSLPMPSGTPLSRESCGVRLKKDSWLLLGMGPIPVRRETLLAQVSGYEARYIPATWYEPAWEDTDYSRPCEHCNGTGVFVAKERFTPAQSEAEEIVF